MTVCNLAGVDLVTRGCKEVDVSPGSETIEEGVVIGYGVTAVGVTSLC